MSIGNLINGVSRNTHSSYSKVNGVWRNNISGWAKVNGVWRCTDNSAIDEKNILGFKLIYTLNATRIHHDNPNLKYNSNIPHIMKLTGDTIGSLDFNDKGIVFEYSREKPEEEGIIVYEGRLYAMHINGSLINVCSVYGSNTNKLYEDQIISEISTIHEVGRIDHLDIKLYGTVIFEDYGYYFNGWNNLFNMKPVIDQSIYPDKKPYKKVLPILSYNILPSHTRDEYFDSCATVGIARDMSSRTNNMIGSSGYMYHSINKITVNGIDKPFVVDIE